MNPISYQSALEELQTILTELQNEEVSIDQLAEKAERAKVLLQYCSQQLRQTEEKINGLFGEED